MPDEAGGAERPAPIRVLVVDDHPLTRSGLRTCLLAHPDLELVGEASDGGAALALVDRVRPDVVLVDLRRPGMDGVELTRRLTAGWPGLRVIAPTAREDGEAVRRVLEAGGHGYLSKSVSSPELAAAIRAVHAGWRVLGPEAADALARVVGAPAVGADLTAREREVLALVAAGLPNGRIAERLSITKATVRFHLRIVFTKLGVATRAEAIALAHQRRLVDPVS